MIDRAVRVGLVIAVVAGMIAWAPARAAAELANLSQRVDEAIDKAKLYLISTIQPDGRARAEDPVSSSYHGGKTALILYALFSAGADLRDERIAKAFQWLKEAKLSGTYAVSLRANVYATLNEPAYLDLLKQDVRWLIEAANSGGGYTYTSQAGKGSTYDNSNSQFGVLGIWAGAQRGVEVPLEYWKLVEQHWIRQQYASGGWGYSRTTRAKTYGSMTAAGVATLFICFENLRLRDFIRCTGQPEYKPLDRGIKWLGENFSAASNPGLSEHWTYYWLYSAERVGLASGLKYFGGHDWYVEGAEWLIGDQAKNGSWPGGDSVAQTAFALLFLARGRHPTLLNKLQYRGKWNSRPRDVAHATEWLSEAMERQVNWHVVDMASSRDWHEAPILYISGAGPVEFAAAELIDLRTFALHGGLLLSEAACNSAEFNADMQKIYKRLFPDLRLERLPDDHPVYSAIHFPIDPSDLPKVSGLFGISNGIRLLAIHSPRELSLALQLGADKAQLPWFKLLANVYLLATDKGQLRPKGERIWPDSVPFEPRAEIAVARIKYDGAYDPEPMAWDRLAVILGNRHKIRLKVSRPMEIPKLDARQWPIAAMTGTKPMKLTLAERLALQRYLKAGGTLIVDAAGGSQPFAESVEDQVLTLLSDGIRAKLDPRVVMGPLEPIERVRYRRLYSMALGSERHRPRIQEVRAGGRTVIVYSPDDILAGLAGYEWYGLRGYSPESAVKIMSNILYHVSKVRFEGAR